MKLYHCVSSRKLVVDKCIIYSLYQGIWGDSEALIVFIFLDGANSLKQKKPQTQLLERSGLATAQARCGSQIGLLSSLLPALLGGCKEEVKKKNESPGRKIGGRSERDRKGSREREIRLFPSNSNCM